MQFAAWEFNSGSLPDWDALPAAGVGGLYFVGNDPTSLVLWYHRPSKRQPDLQRLVHSQQAEHGVQCRLLVRHQRRAYLWLAHVCGHIRLLGGRSGRGKRLDNPAYNQYLADLSTTGYTASFLFQTTLYNAGYLKDSLYQYVDDGTWDQYSDDPMLQTVTPSSRPVR